MICVKFDWKWPCGSGEGDFSNSSMYFHYFVIISPWKRQSPSFEQSWIRCIVPSLVEIGQVVLEKKISKICQCIFAIISLWKRMEPFIWTNLNFLLPRMPCAKFGWNWPSGWKCEKFTTTTMTTTTTTQQGTTDNRWSEKLTPVLSSCELKTIKAGVLTILITKLLHLKVKKVFDFPWNIHV